MWNPGRSFRHFTLLLWKNFVQQKRQIVVTIFELLLPTIFAVLLVGFRDLVVQKQVTNATIFIPYPIDSLPTSLHPKQSMVWNLTYAPNVSVANSIMDNSVKFLSNSTVTVERALGFATQEEMLNYVELQQREKDTSSLLGAVVWNNPFPSDDRLELPLFLNYSLRLSASARNSPSSEGQDLTGFTDTSSWETDKLFPPVQVPGPREEDSVWGGEPGYMREGFLSLQHAVDRSIVEYQLAQRNLSNQVHVVMRRYPYPPYNDDPYLLVIQLQLPALLMLSLVFTALSIVKDIVREKELKLKESMKMMGLGNWMHWLAWFVKYLVFLLIPVIIITVLFTIDIGNGHGSVITYTDPSVLFVFLMVYSISGIMFCFMLSTFFSKANSGAAAGGVLWFLTYIPYFFISPRYATLSRAAKLASCLPLNTGMSMGANIIGLFEGINEGVQWSNINRGVTVDDNFTFLDVIGMLLLDAVLCSLVTWYVDAVYPGDYGMPQPLYFPFTRSYWFGNSHQFNEVDEERQPLLGDSASGAPRSEFFEEDQPGTHAGIEIRNLRKVFQKGKVAVAGTWLKMYEGQISVLLGHNGAGKTTTMWMLTGFVPPTSGTARINGYDIQSQMSEVRSSMGLCPQHDVLFTDLTVAEHLYFFARLKGLASDQVQGEIDHYIEALGLEDKRDTLSKSLSGGMKRKLSVGIALIADSKVIMLDEPTSGMDAAARRATWDLLQRHRAGRTILLTTHFMDEADLLGDRITIMAGGELQCSGSSLFLKNRYGVGYHMTLVKKPDCQVEKIVGLVQSHVPHAKIETNVSGELSFILPHESSPSFEQLFTQLEQNKDSLGIASYGASVTTMEEVFLKVGEKHNGDKSAAANGLLGPGISQMHVSHEPNGSAAAASIDISPSSSPVLGQEQENSKQHLQLHSQPCQELDNQHYVRNTHLSLILQQFWAMFFKRFLHTRRNFLVMVAQLLIPLIYTIFALIVVKTFPGTQDLPPLPLDLSKYGNNDVSVASAGTNQTEGLAHCYSLQFQGTPSQVLDINTLDNYKDHLPDDIINYLNRTAAKDVAIFNLQNQVAASFQVNEYTDLPILATALFNDQSYHSVAMALNAVSNAVLKYYTNNSYSIHTINYPLPRSVKEKISDETNTGFTGYAVSFNLLFGMVFLSASFVVFLVAEKSNKSKHIQFVSGVNPLIFWLSTFAWDIINYLVPTILTCILFAAFGVEAYVDKGRIFEIFLLLFLYGWAIIPLMYLLSFLFEVPSTGFVRVCLFNILTGMVFYLAVYILDIPDLKLQHIANGLDWAFLISPNYCLGYALSNYYQNYEFEKICTVNPLVELYCKLNGIEFSTNYIAWNKSGIGRYLVFLAWEGFFFFALVLMVEFGIFRQLLYLIKGMRGGQVDHAKALLKRQQSVQEDEDVAAERQRIELASRADLAQTDMLVLDSLRKVYNKQLVVAVDGISIGVPPGECFGLLGNNGAGKTTTFKMLTGDETVTGGDAMVNGWSIISDIQMVQQSIGYCPQYDALIELMTGRETLSMYARLRGVPEKHIPGEVQRLLTNLLLQEHADKLVKAYSGGNKRKLSAAIALVADTPLVFLDEPTTGMDPAAKRMLWDVLSRECHKGRAIILTSHSMEECEALCTRMAIMVNGVFKCLGSTQHLKSRFGEGYTLLAKVALDFSDQDPSQKLQPLKNFIEQTFPGSHLKDEHESNVHYHITDDRVSWAQIFGVMERAKVKFHIEDYSVSQTTLEQIFINFVRGQRVEDV